MYPQCVGSRAYCFLAGASRSQSRCPQDKKRPPYCRHNRSTSTYHAMPTFAPTGACLCLPSRSGHGRREILEETDLSVPRRLRKNRWQVGVRDTTLRLAGGDLGDREAKQQVPSHGPYQEPLMRVTTVIAGQVKHKNNRRTTVFSWSTAGVRPRAVMHSRLSTFDFRARLSACAGCVKVVEGERVSCTNIHIGNAVKKHSDTNSGT